MTSFEVEVEKLEDTTAAAGIILAAGIGILAWAALIAGLIL